MTRIASTVKWVVVMMGIVLALWLPLMASVHYLELKAGKDLRDLTWITRTETLRLMRYHGTCGLKITDDRVYIWRDSTWIQVMKRKPA
jgi:hypothetical protein